ncbi:MAG: amidase [Rhodobacteraceae bacterium]|nr:amidase [Paracoccaceae bacterium]
MSKTQHMSMTAAKLVKAIASGEVSSEAAAQERLDKIEAEDGALQAWSFTDRVLVERKALSLKAHRQSGAPLGPLHGLPIGVKDIIDTADMPTENGTVVDKGRRPRQDATLVRRLLAAGAVVLGKTHTTECAYFSPGPTRNPHNPARTPGGSSSGSAAAVAAGMVQVAIGTQTNGSVIRPASFCGVVGFKPSYGRIPRNGLLPLSKTLDQVGVFGTTIEDVALVAEVLIAPDGVDESVGHTTGAGLFDVATSSSPVRPQLAFVKGPTWGRAESYMAEAFAELVSALGDGVDEVPLPSVFEEGVANQRTVMAAEMAFGLGGYLDKAPELISAQLTQLIEEGRGVSALDYQRAVAARPVFNAGLEQLFERYDAIVTPAAPGEAPMGLDATGDPAFCTLWSYCGTPAITLPLMTGPNDMPIGVQLVGPVGDDARLLRTARWLIERLQEGAA